MLRDIALGVRLAVGGRGTSWSRLALGAVGIGLATAVLLVGASAHHVVASRSARVAAATPIAAAPGRQAPLQLIDVGGIDFHGTWIAGTYVRATVSNAPVPNAPVPPGLARLPGPGEVVVSPALARLLASPDGAALRGRLPARVIGQIGQAGLGGPQDLTYVAGFAPDQTTAATQALIRGVDGFGPTGGAAPENAALVAMSVVGAVALLIPILIMITVSSRIAGAARDRRLAALRLVGAGGLQVRRIAAAESLVSALAGLLLGGALFLAFRQVAPRIQLFGFSVFTSDIAAPAALVALVVVAVPVLSVLTALFALRRTVVEPLGVVRGGSPVRRRLWWRVALTVAGVVLLLLASSDQQNSTQWLTKVAAGASCLLIGVPALLPYLLERTVAVLRGGPPAWQLAVRRLQLDGGTAARVVSGVAVVLAGSIALQAVLTGDALRFGGTPVAAPSGFNYVTMDRGVSDQVDAAIQRSGAARSWYPMTTVGAVSGAGSDAIDNQDAIGIASCAVIERLTDATGCRDGDVFGMDPKDVGTAGVPPGASIRVGGDPTTWMGRPPLYGTWRIPAHPRTAAWHEADIWPASSPLYLVTPAAIAGVPLGPDPDVWTLVWTNPSDTTADDRLANAAALQPLRATLALSATPTLNPGQANYFAVRTGILIGSLFTLALAGISLFVLALEQVRERRRALAMLVAAGVPRGVLARSLLWQVAVPVAVGVLAAIGTGILLATLVLRLTSTPMSLDWPAIGTFSAVAVLLVLLVTVATLPALGSATRMTALRTE